MGRTQQGLEVGRDLGEGHLGRKVPQEATLEEAFVYLTPCCRSGRPAETGLNELSSLSFKWRCGGGRGQRPEEA